MFYVEIVAYFNEEVVKRSKGFESERQADKLEDGYNISLDHEHYFTRVVSD